MLHFMDALGACFPVFFYVSIPSEDRKISIFDVLKKWILIEGSPIAPTLPTLIKSNFLEIPNIFNYCIKQGKSPPLVQFDQ